eukprot:2043425-Pleurochrysis_carterae.AAC.2
MLRALADATEANSKSLSTILPLLSFPIVSDDKACHMPLLYLSAHAPLHRLLTLRTFSSFHFVDCSHLRAAERPRPQALPSSLNGAKSRCRLFD